MTSDQEWKAPMLKGRHRATGVCSSEPVEPVDVKQLLLAYSEWLDGQGLVIGDGHPVIREVPRKLSGEDTRTHSDLIAAFLNEQDYRESELSG